MLIAAPSTSGLVNPTHKKQHKKENGFSREREKKKPME
jgi:hypothetical protein